MCWIWRWCWLFLIWTGNAFFRQIFSEKSKLSFEDESWHPDKFQCAQFSGNLHVCYFGREMHFLGKFSSKNQNGLFIKFGIYTYSIMLNSMVKSIYLVLDRKYPSWTNFVKKIKTVSNESWYLDQFEHAEFDDNVHLSCFGRKIWSLR